MSETGAHGENPLPVANLKKDYCWRYTADTNYQIEYVHKPATDVCTSLPASAAWAELPNDYVMLLISTATVQTPTPAPVIRKEHAFEDLICLTRCVSEMN